MPRLGKPGLVTGAVAVVVAALGLALVIARPALSDPPRPPEKNQGVIVSHLGF